MGGNNVIAIILGIDLAMILLAAFCYWRWYVNLRTRLLEQRRLRREAKIRIEFQAFPRGRPDKQRDGASKNGHDTSGRPKGRSNKQQSKSINQNQKPKQKAKAKEPADQAQDTSTTSDPGAPLNGNNNDDFLDQPSHDNQGTSGTVDQGTTNQYTTNSKQNSEWDENDNTQTSGDQPATGAWSAEASDAQAQKSEEKPVEKAPNTPRSGW
ncbi:hypothetical protein FE257_003715 [Aspergillus nanangensis]|uniref:Uncharacterized protein n=1 Tax=Aspergillus nanangensis TaxID=2582783 RepID=A0AAD4GXL7_ASPNN|nr:hypothetical protein FE257_003715 [Aspergillus nanangensis]